MSVDFIDNDAAARIIKLSVVLDNNDRIVSFPASLLSQNKQRKLTIDRVAKKEAETHPSDDKHKKRETLVGRRNGLVSRSERHNHIGSH